MVAPGLLSFGAAKNEGAQYAINVGLKKRDAGDVMRDFIDDIKPAMKSAGLQFPKLGRNWNRSACRNRLVVEVTSEVAQTFSLCWLDYIAVIPNCTLRGEHRLKVCATFFEQLWCLHVAATKAIQNIMCYLWPRHSGTMIISMIDIPAAPKNMRVVPYARSQTNSSA